MNAAVLIVAEHDGAELYPGTLSAVTAGAQIAGGGTVDVLLAGHGVEAVAAACAAVAGVGKVLVADDAVYAHPATEDVAALVAANAGDYTHILAAASTFGKALIPYAAALADMQSISDISEVVAADTFVRPIYAGNALATVKSVMR